METVEICLEKLFSPSESFSHVMMYTRFFGGRQRQWAIDKSEFHRRYLIGSVSPVKHTHVNCLTVSNECRWSTCAQKLWRHRGV